jgi:hypothetical protein
VPDGFKVADAFVDVAIDLDESGLLHDVETASDKAGNILSEGLADGGKEGGRRAGQGLTDGVDGGLRGGRGRFASAFAGIGDEGGKSAGGRSAKGIALGIIGGVTDAAGKVGGILTKGLTAVGPAGPAVGAVIIAGVAAAAPVAGAALAGGLMAGVAVAGIGLGIAASIRQPAVKGALLALKHDATDALSSIGKDWEPTMLSVIANVRGDVRGIGSELRSALAPTKAYVQPLVDGFMSLVRNALPGFTRMLANAGPIINVLADGLGEIGTALSDAFSDISGETDEAAAGLQTMLYLVADLVSIGGSVIAWLADGYRKILDWNVGLLSLLAMLPGVGGQFAEWRDEMKELQATAHGTGPAFDRAAGSFNSMSSSVSRASQSNEAMAMRQRILNGTMAQGADAAGDLKAAMDALNGTAQSAEQAQLAYEEAIDNATASLKENGKTTTDNTTKGRANRTALLQLAQAGQQRAQAQYDQTAATKGTSAAEGAAARAYANSREKLIATARAMGMSRGEAVAYANKIMAIPKSWTTKIKADTGQAMHALNGVRTSLAGIPNSKTVTIAMKVTGQQNASAAAHALRKQGMNTGGAVTGPGMKGVDSELRLLAPGEHVLTDKEVDAAGGHSAIEAWRSALRAGVKVSGTRSSSTAGSGAAAPQQQMQQVFQFAPGAFVLDLSSFRNLQDVMDAVTGLVTTSRTYRSSTVLKAGMA